MPFLFANNFCVVLTSYGCGSGNDRNFLALTIFVLELHFAIDESEKGEIAAKAYVFARVENSAYLTNEDVTGFYHFATEALNTAHFRLTIATVLCTTTSFF
jgi:hypothetical protein